MYCLKRQGCNFVIKMCPPFGKWRGKRWSENIMKRFYYIGLYWIIFPTTHPPHPTPQLRPQRKPLPTKRPTTARKSSSHAPKIEYRPIKYISGGAPPFSPGDGPGDRTRCFPREKTHINKHNCFFFNCCIRFKAIFDFLLYIGRFISICI